MTKKRLEEIRSISDSEIDFSDIPELSKEDFRNVHFRNLKPRKKFITFRIDLDVLSWLKNDTSKGYQTKINDILRMSMNNR